MTEVNKPTAIKGAPQLYSYGVDCCNEITGYDGPCHFVCYFINAGSARTASYMILFL